MIPCHFYSYALFLREEICIHGETFFSSTKKKKKSREKFYFRIIIMGDQFFFTVPKKE